MLFASLIQVCLLNFVTFSKVKQLNKAIVIYHFRMQQSVLP